MTVKDLFKYNIDADQGGTEDFDIYRFSIGVYSYTIFKNDREYVINVKGLYESWLYYKDLLIARKYKLEDQ